MRNRCKHVDGAAVFKITLNRKPTMKQLTFITITLGLFLSGSLFAGPPDVSKQVAPPPPPPNYGVGFYGAIDMGANVYQDRGGNRTFTQDNPNLLGFGDTLEISPKNDVGFFGGIKLGYVFGTGVVRPTVEGDFFYNGFRGGGNFTLRDSLVMCWHRGTRLRGSTRARSWRTSYCDSHLETKNSSRMPAPGSASIMRNLRAPSSQNPNTGTVTVNTGGGANHADLAWQIIAGADYYWNPKFSTFIEYKFLEYTSTQIDTRQSRVLGQQLIGAGVRFHF